MHVAGRRNGALARAADARDGAAELSELFRPPVGMRPQTAVSRAELSLFLLPQGAAGLVRHRAHESGCMRARAATQ